MRTPLSPARIRAAWILAITVDCLQWGLIPLSGGLSQFADKPLDIITMVAMLLLVGWHWAFLPTFVVELVPFLELVPTWTLAVWLTTRGRRTPELA